MTVYKPNAEFYNKIIIADAICRRWPTLQSCTKDLKDQTIAKETHHAIALRALDLIASARVRDEVKLKNYFDLLTVYKPNAEFYNKIIIAGAICRKWPTLQSCTKDLKDQTIAKGIHHVIALRALDCIALDHGDDESKLQQYRGLLTVYKPNAQFYRKATTTRWQGPGLDCCFRYKFSRFISLCDMMLRSHRAEATTATTSSSTANVVSSSGFRSSPPSSSHLTISSTGTVLTSCRSLSDGVINNTTSSSPANHSSAVGVVTSSPPSSPTSNPCLFLVGQTTSSTTASTSTGSASHSPSSAGVVTSTTTPSNTASNPSTSCTVQFDRQ